MALTIDEGEIRRNGPGNILGVCWKQWRAERILARRGIHFRTKVMAELEQAYAAMSDEEFTSINARQDWANWRTIPRCLSGRVPDRPLRVLDLGCGAGDSTRVLAFYCPQGSKITGFELAEPLVEIARRRTYPHHAGLPATVAFRCQGVSETLREPDGMPVASGSVDLVNASGVVGHHLDRLSIGPLVEELSRVLAPDGIAMLDVGPTLRSADLIQVMAPARLRPIGHCRSWLFDPTGQILFQRG